jgi:hypothetical protein
MFGLAHIIVLLAIGGMFFWALDERLPLVAAFFGLAALLLIARLIGVIE